MKNNLYISASEISEYVYCQRAWWLRIQGLLSANQAMLEGEIKHTTLAKWLSVYKKLFGIALAMILMGIILSVIAFLFFMNQ